MLLSFSFVDKNKNTITKQNEINLTKLKCIKLDSPYYIIKNNIQNILSENNKLFFTFAHHQVFYQILPDIVCIVHIHYHQ